MADQSPAQPLNYASMCYTTGLNSSTLVVIFFPFLNDTTTA